MNVLCGSCEKVALLRVFAFRDGGISRMGDIHFIMIILFRRMC